MQFRKDLGLSDTDPLDAKKLAKLIDVTVWCANQINKVDIQDMTVLCDESDTSWSAFALRIGTKHLVVYKPVASQGRLNSVVMHELSHIILGHKLAKAGVLSDGSLAPANYDQEQENEADWLAGTLLLPRPALMKIKRMQLSDDQACEIFKVSRQMLTWRTRMTGINKQFRRTRHF